MSAPLLSVEDLRVSFHLDGAVVEAVKGVSFAIPEGGSVALVGESGSGKSVVSQSILRILPGAARIESGRLLFRDPATAGEPVDLAAFAADSQAMRSIRGGRISIVFQEPMTSLSPLHTVGDQIDEAVLLHQDVGRVEAAGLTVHVLRQVGFPDPERAYRTYPFELSGGLRQRAMIAMALVCRPALLIADEPTTALDVTIQAQTLRLIKDLQAELGMALLIITHDLGVVANMADDVVVMYHGRVMEAGPLRPLFKRPKHPYLKALMNAVPRFDMKPGERLVPIREAAGDAKALASFSEDRAHGPSGAPLLEVVDVSKAFQIRNSGLFGGSAGAVRAVDGVSLTVNRGECLGLVGESGCGKTTLSKIIMRALSPDDGAVTFRDGDRPVDVLGLTGTALNQFRQRVQFVFQDPFGSLNPRMTVFDLISEPLVIHGIGDESQRRERVSALMRAVGLDVRFLKRYPHSFSGGQRQRIGIARALALNPELLILDEPVSALDVSIQAQILNLLRDLRHDLSLTYLLISHNLAVVDYIADRIAVMCAGRIVEFAETKALFRSPTHPYTKALLAAVPDPSPDHRLDFAALMEGKASDPARWPAPFAPDPAAPSSLVEIGPGHFVRARADQIGALS